ncbi:MAG TPA: hypothetical protein VMW34_04100, partial [Anaerolineales bacterium]|nr:hypothetical protein [Anaerolineales bacterium]
WELKGNPVLQLTFYTSYLIPGMFLAFGSQISPLMQMSRRQFLCLVSGLLILLIAPFYTPFRSLLPSQLHILYPTVIIILGILGVMLLRLRTTFINAKSMALFFLFLGAANFTIIGSHWQVDFASQQQPNQLFLTVVKSDAILRDLDPSVKLRFWYSKDEPQGYIFCSVASTRLWGYRLINDSFPILEDAQLAPNVQGLVKINPGTRIVILSDDKDAFEKANAAFERTGQHAEFLSEEKVEQGSIQFTMTFIEVTE